MNGVVMEGDRSEQVPEEEEEEEKQNKCTNRGCPQLLLAKCSRLE